MSGGAEQGAHYFLMRVDCDPDPPPAALQGRDFSQLAIFIKIKKAKALREAFSQSLGRMHFYSKPRRNRLKAE